jgi:hypothetical protein
MRAVVLAPDQRGVDESDLPSHGYRLWGRPERVARDLLEFVTAAR